MNPGVGDKPATWPVAVDPARCDGCLACLWVCPTRAIRVRGGKAHIRENACIVCGECLKTCPKSAIGFRRPTRQGQDGYKIRAVLPSPVLYTQFGDRTPPNDVLLALGQLGYDYVFDQALFCEWVNLYLDQVMERGQVPLPAISPTCPAVVRLISIRYQALIPHVIRTVPPREVGARHIRAFLGRRLGLADHEIGLYHVTPCPAKCLDAGRPGEVGGSRIDRALGIDEIYGPLLVKLKELTDEDRETMLFRGGGFGIGWEMSGGEAAGLRHVENALSVCGLRETMEALEMIELGRLGDVRYVECRVCEDGCLGGPLTVAHRYQARDTLRKLVCMYGADPRIRIEDIARQVRDGLFDTAEIQPAFAALSADPLRAIQRRREIDRIAARLPGKYCGACGAPDCRSLAEDVAAGLAVPEDCPFLDGRNLPEGPTIHRNQGKNGSPPG